MTVVHVVPEPALEGNKLPQIPRFSGSVDASLTLRKQSIFSLVWHGTSSQFDDDRNQFLLDSASEFDARLIGRAGHVGWSLTIENLDPIQLLGNPYQPHFSCVILRDGCRIEATTSHNFERLGSRVPDFNQGSSGVCTAIRHVLTRSAFKKTN